MPVKVKPMDPAWMEAYLASKPDDDTQADVNNALQDYTDETNAAGTKLNKELERITKIKYEDL